MSQSNILVLVGSLGERSYNRSLAEYMTSLSTQSLSISTQLLHHIPFYSSDFEPDSIPKEVVELRKRVLESAGVIIATPEYNGFVPGALVNAFDWLSRTYEGVTPLLGKPAALAGATTGGFGTARAQTFLIALTGICGMRTMTNKRLSLSRVSQVIDESGTITDATTKDVIQSFVTNFTQFINN